MPNSKSGKIGASSAALGLLGNGGNCDQGASKMSGLLMPASNADDSSIDGYDDDEEEDDDEYDGGDDNEAGRLNVNRDNDSCGGFVLQGGNDVNNLTNCNNNTNIEISSLNHENIDVINSNNNSKISNIKINESSLNNINENGNPINVNPDGFYHDNNQQDRMNDEKYKGVCYQNKVNLVDYV